MTPIRNVCGKYEGDRMCHDANDRLVITISNAGLRSLNLCIKNPLKYTSSAVPGTIAPIVEKNR